MGVTSIEVAREAGVSQATVSRVLQESGKVHPDTRARVLAAMARMGYSPNLLARAMKTHRTDTIGVVVAHLSNPFYPAALDEVGRALSEYPKRMVLWTSNSAGEDAALQSIRQGLVDGVLFISGMPETASLRAAVEANLPVVLMNRSVPDLQGDQVTSDNVRGAAEAAKHLLELGHHRIGFIGSASNASTANERRVGFETGLAGGGISISDEMSRVGELSYKLGFASVQEFLSAPQPPTAVFGVNDITAIGAIEGARALGVRVPEDLSIIGYDDIELASWESFRLTTVSQPLVEMARKAVQLLVERIAEPSRDARHERLTGELIVRATTTIAP